VSYILRRPSPANNKRRRLPAINVTNLPRSGAAVCITLGGRTVENMMELDIG